MLYKLSNKEVATLLFHMNVMRKPVKKGLKKNYGILAHKPYLKSYDSVVSKLQNLMSIEGESYQLELEEKENQMYQDFLKWYVAELEKDFAGEEIEEEAKEGFYIMKKLVHEFAVMA